MRIVDLAVYVNILGELLLLNFYTVVFQRGKFKFACNFTLAFFAHLNMVGLLLAYDWYINMRRTLTCSYYSFFKRCDVHSSREV
jgi:hypothetical protein